MKRRNIRAVENERSKSN